jgi:WS/DGAT/MGAT family acyltransferase
MQRVKGADAHHLYEERVGQPMHTLKVGILDPSGTGDYTAETVRRIVAERVHLLPPLRWRVVTTPLHLFHPSWLDGGLPDLDYHVRQTTVAAPGGKRELAETISSIAGTHLDRSRPLWELWVLDGLAGGKVAVVFKLHHSLADGLSSAQLIIDLMDTEADGGDRDESSVLSAERAPGTARRILGAAPELGRLLGRFPGLAARSRQASAIARQREKAGMTMPARAFSGPLTRWNHPLTPNRSYGFTTVDLAELRAVKDAFHCTLNDVVLAVASGAIRGYLSDHGELPETPLTAAVPVSIRTPQESRTWGNRLSNVFPSLATDVADPGPRLLAIHESMAGAKAYHDAKDPQLLQDWFDFYPLHQSFKVSATKLMRMAVKRPTYNVIISNVRGPATRLFSHGAPLVAIHSMGPLVDDLGLNVTAWSYLDGMSFGVVTCRELIPDLWDLIDRIPVALADLTAAAPAGSTTADGPGPAGRVP